MRIIDVKHHIRGALEGPVTPDCPASILRRYASTRLYLDPDSALQLSLA